MMTTRKKIQIIIPLLVLTAVAATLSIWWIRMTHAIDSGQCIAMVRVVRHTTLSIDGQSMVLSAHATQPGGSYRIGTPQTGHTDTLYVPALWVNAYTLFPSCRGRLAAAYSPAAHNADSTSLSRKLRTEEALYTDMLAYYEQGSGSTDTCYHLQTHIGTLKREIGNLRYYMRVHGVQDEGYHDIAAYEQSRQRLLTQLQQAEAQRDQHLKTIRQRLSMLRSALARPSRAHLSEMAEYDVIYTDGHRLHHTSAQLADKNSRQGYTLLQTETRHTPDGIYAISMMPWITHIAEQLYASAFGAYYGRYAMTPAGHDKPHVTPRIALTPMRRMPQHYTGYWIDRQGAGITYAGYWKAGYRQGKGMTYQPDSITIYGRYAADTLYYGTRHTPDGSTYTGYMDRHAAPHGHGTMHYPGDRIYSGNWNRGQREGFGYQTGLNTALHIGEWRGDSYKGERLTYTSDRIYGIDISRFQHEIGKKKYAIDWDRLRISHLGTSSRKKINGRADYPVSFIYIKATEGTTLRNRYYAADYRQARSHGIHTGSYHFFSTTTPGKAQARHFLRSARFSQGDLPPVLDVEPSAQQIARMGGPSALWTQVRAWLAAVKQHTGVAPVLYISQSFVNRYLPYAPDIKSQHQVWIARYGEYKPDVRLAYWQLCPDGRVSGIHGEVDINVFNGYKAEFKNFISQHCIP